MAKKIIRIAKLELIGTQAKPGPELASVGIDMGGFTREFNEATKERAGDVVPVVITAYEDRSFSFILKTTPTAVMIKKAVNLKTAAHNPPFEIVAEISLDQIKEIAEYKMVDLNANTIDKAMAMVMGTARNMGVHVEGTEVPVLEKKKKSKSKAMSLESQLPEVMLDTATEDEATTDAPSEESKDGNEE